MKRQIVLDTETTGLNPRLGNRILEIGCVELINRKLTGHNLHFYINPERESEEGALAVHGITSEFLQDKPKFHEIVETLLDYVKGAEILIHNAPFDLGFLDAELARLERASFASVVDGVVDTLAQAKELHPGKRNSLDALCDRYEISNAHRALHGALLDAELLAEVYLAMSRGQNSLGIELEEELSDRNTEYEHTQAEYAEIRLLSASVADGEAHREYLEELEKANKSPSIWKAVGA